MAELEGLERHVLRSNAWGQVTQRFTLPWILGFASLPEEARVLEVGSGGGFNAEVMLERFPGWRLVATDYDPEMVELCANRLSVSIWEFRYDNNNDGIFETYVDQVSTLSFPNGMASGETGRRGGSGTNAYDHFIDLKRTTSTAGDTGWTAWSGNTWWKECIPGWGWDWMLQNEYQILDGIPCN